jgi:hypothetical protein
VTEETTRRTRLLTAGCFAFLVTAMLCVAAGGILVSLAIQGFFDDLETPSGVILSGNAEVTRYRLEEAAKDGSLSAKEIDYATGDARWSRTGDDSTILITVSYPADNEAAAGCYHFPVPRPVSPSADVHRPKLAAGPD